MKNIILTAAFLTGAALASAPAAAQSQPAGSALERADNVARTAIRTVYGEAGYRLCGARCAAPAARVGETIYTKAQAVSTTGAAKLQAIGKRLRRTR